MKNPKPGVLFLLPPAYERLDEVMECLESSGFKAYIAHIGSAEQENARKKTLIEELKEWPDLACVIYPDDFDFYDDWVDDIKKNIHGNISDVLTSLKNSGLALVPYRMGWDGPFDDLVTITSPPINVLKAVRSAISNKLKAIQ